MIEYLVIDFASINHNSYANVLIGVNTSSSSTADMSTQILYVNADTVTTDSPSIDNNAHLLWLHTNYQPCMILISKFLIGYENCASWKRSMQIALSAKNKLVIINGD